MGSFNGATDLHRWKLAAVRPERDRGTRFNGATDLHRWKHNQEDNHEGFERASMGPPIYIGGNGLVIPKVVFQRQASMGPPIYIGGNKRNIFHVGMESARLQWGHRFTSVETSPFANHVIQLKRASMGPPIYIGGNRTKFESTFSEVLSFNGATDLHRWKLPLSSSFIIGISSFNGATDLHRWKRTMQESLSASTYTLQWGHRFTSVETCFKAGCGWADFSSFNGATDLHRWKQFEWKGLGDR